MKAKSQLIGRSPAFGLFLLAAAFGFAGSAGAQAPETPSPALEAAAPDGNANVAETPGNIVCVTFAGLKPEFENAQRQVEAAESALAEINAAEVADLAKWAANPGGGETCAVEARSEPLAESPTAETDQVSAVVIGEAVPPSDAPVHIPDDLAQRLGTGGELERRTLEALSLEEYKLGHLTKPELRRLLGFGTRDALDGFLKAHDVFEPDIPGDLGPARVAVPEGPDEESRARARQAAANIIARRKGVTLAGLNLKDLINEGRP